MVIVVSILTCAALVGLDQYFKYLVVEYIKPIEYYDVIDDVLRLRYVENTGAVFGSFATHTMLLTVFSILLLGFTIWFLYNNKSKSKLMNICLLLMISGGIGNIIDRIRLHYVVDYIEPTFINFAVFNFADCLITVGAFILIGYLIVDIIKDYKKGKSEANDSSKVTDDADADIVNDTENVVEETAEGDFDKAIDDISEEAVAEDNKDINDDNCEFVSDGESVSDGTVIGDEDE